MVRFIILEDFVVERRAASHGLALRRMAMSDHARQGKDANGVERT